MSEDLAERTATNIVVLEHREKEADTETLMSAEEAARITTRIRIQAHKWVEARNKLMELVREAKNGRAHLALGYPSWTAYLVHVFNDDERWLLPPKERQEFVLMLSNEGLPTRAIAPIVGVKQPQVVKDLAAVRQDVIPKESAASSEDAGVNAKATADITGLDGKHYHRTPHREAASPLPEVPSKPRRSPLAKSAYQASTELRRAGSKVKRICDDDRFRTNRDKLAAILRSDIETVLENCQTMLDQFDEEHRPQQDRS